MAVSSDIGSAGAPPGRGLKIAVDLSRIQCFLFEQCFDKQFQFVEVTRDHIACAAERLLDNIAHSHIEPGRGGIGERLLLNDLATEEDMLLASTEINWSDLVAHTPETDHAAGERGRLLEIAFGAGGDLVEDHDFGCAATQRGVEPAEQIGFGDVVAIFFRRLDGDTHARPRGTMLTLRSGSVPGVRCATSA